MRKKPGALSPISFSPVLAQSMDHDEHSVSASSFLCQSWSGQGWGLGEAPPTVRPRPHILTARTVGLVGQQGTAQALPLGLCPASFRGPWLTCLVPGGSCEAESGGWPRPWPRERWLPRGHCFFQ